MVTLPAKVKKNNPVVILHHSLSFFFGKNALSASMLLVLIAVL